jgi:hypothetical protein
MTPAGCVVLVPYTTAVDPACERGLAAVERAGYAVRRLAGAEPLDLARSVAAADALADGFDELLWVGPDVGFEPDAVAALRRHGLPVVAGLVPEVRAAGFACEFPPGTESVVLGDRGGVIDLAAVGFGFTFVRREVFERVRARFALPACDAAGGPGFAPWFLPLVTDEAPPRYRTDDYAFCHRAAACGFRIAADTTVRLFRYGRHGFSWEEAAGDPPRHRSITVPLVRPTPAAPAGDDGVTPPRNPLRGPATPLPDGFPRIGLYIPTYPANRASCEATVASVRESDWGAAPTVMEQPADWPVGHESAARNYRRVLERVLADGCDFSLLLEDDVRVNRHLRHNLHALPLVRRDQCDYLSLYLPDTVADPWQRRETALGYRLAWPRYASPDRHWQKLRVWGAQGYLLSARLVRAVLDRWPRLHRGADTRVMAVCAELRVPLWYTDPCLVEHVPVGSAFGTPPAYAPDFDPNFRLSLPTSGVFQPPEVVPGWLTRAEAELLWSAVTGKRVLELGTAAGRSTVSMAQGAARLVSVDVTDQAEAAEWVRRYGAADRVRFERGDAAEVCGRLAERFGVALIDTGHDAASVARDIGAALRLLEPGGLLAFHDYPDPGWPDVRRVVDDHARRLGWRRVGQADYLGLFST